MKADEIVSAIYNRRESISPDELRHAILEIERILNVKIPDDYKRFLARYGRPFFTVPSQEGEFPGRANGADVAYWHGIEKDNYDDLLMILEFYSTRLPDQCLCIGSTIFGDKYLYDLSNGREYVYLWWHEEEVDDKLNSLPYYSNMTLLAESFTEFLDKLHPEVLDDDPE
jgi:hypothetical protein